MREFYPAARKSLHCSQLTDTVRLACDARIRAMAEHEVVVYSRRGCHLCEVVKESLSKLERQGGFTWRDVDVDSDDDLRRQFTDEVPVVFIDGKKAFKYRMDEREFLHKLAAR
jgi:glutaredoxin